MTQKLTVEAIKNHIEHMIQARIPTQMSAHEQFNNGVKFATDYILEFINVRKKLTKWQSLLRRIKYIMARCCLKNKNDQERRG